MTVVFDASFLIPLLDENARIDVPDARSKVSFLFAELDKAREVILVPTPALAEFLTGAGEAAPKYLQIITSSARFRVEPFDTLAAVELAADTARAKEAGDKKGSIDAPWQKVKFDRQIVAIARVHAARLIYSNDPHFGPLVGQRGPQVVDFAALPMPPEPPQLAMDLNLKNADKPNGED
jgi:predicted nucleic acid-binding protein